MLAGIDHLVIAVHDPDVEVERLARALGVPAGGGGDHPGWGTRNRLVWLGDTYVELLGVSDPALAAGSWIGRPAVDALAAGPALVGWAIASDALDADLETLRGRGASLGAAASGDRRRPDGRVVRWRLALPPRIALDRPFLIEHDPTGAEWTTAERSERATRPGRLAWLALPVDGVPGLAAGDGHAAIGRQQVRLLGPAAPGPVIGLTGLAAAGDIELLGCRWVSG